MRNRKRGWGGPRGFTLVELLVVIVIIAVLAAFAMPRYGKYIEKAKMGEAISILGGKAGEAEGFMAQNNAFPTPQELGLQNTAEWIFGITGQDLTATRTGGDNSGAVITYRRNGGNWCWAYRGGSLRVEDSAVPRSKCCNAGCS